MCETQNQPTHSSKGKSTMQPSLTLIISDKPEYTCTQMTFPKNNMAVKIDQMKAGLEDIRPAELFEFVQLWSKIANEHTLPLVISLDVVCQLVYAAYWAGLTPHLEISYPTGVADALIPLARINFSGESAPEPIVIERLADENGNIDKEALQQRIHDFLRLTTGEVEVTGMTFTLDSWLSPYLSDDLNAQVLESVWQRGNIKII